MRHDRQAREARLFVLGFHRGLAGRPNKERGISTISAASITGVVTRRLSTDGVVTAVLEGVLEEVLKAVLDLVRFGGAGGVAGAVGSVRYAQAEASGAAGAGASKDGRRLRGVAMCGCLF
jgi:hypothetical protein